MTAFLTDSADITRVNCCSRLNLKQRSELGQFLTPATIARFMAGQFNNLVGHISLLDPGAGVGVLTSAVVEKLLANPNEIKSCFITAYEIEPIFINPLNRCLIECCAALQNKGIQANYCLRKENFIEAFDESNLPLFTHVILNPPYKKIHNRSIEKKILKNIGVETVNLYSAFVWLAALQLAEGGEMSAITPRSFCNGAYFRPFRKAFLKSMGLKKIHIFESRSAAFSEDKVLQENVIFHAIKTTNQPSYVKITSNSEAELEGLVFVTAFPSRKGMTRYLAEISWETEVWIADQPEHMIHFNGERFLGPYEDSASLS
jgi:adenine-specific DNA-methyltransferase